MQTVIMRVSLLQLRLQSTEVSLAVGRMSRRCKSKPAYEGLDEFLSKLCQHLKDRHQVLITGTLRGGSFKAMKVR